MSATSVVPQRHAVHAMGTRFEFVALHEDAACAHDAMERAAEIVCDLHRLWSVHEPASVVSEIMRAGSQGRAVRVDDETCSMMRFCAKVWHASGGAFDITASLDGTTRGFACVEVDARASTVALRGRGLRLNLGAVAKGWALDRVGEALREYGIGVALLHGGTSSVLAMGAPPGQSAWRVRIGRDGPVAELRDCALGVSMQRDCHRPGHIIDPRTGAPVAGCDGAACLTTSAAEADAWSTAALVLGGVPEAGPFDARWYFKLSGACWRDSAPVRDRIKEHAR